MKKRSFILIMAILFLPSLMTAAAEKYLVLTRNNTEVAKFSLNDAPVITFSGGNLVVTCNGEEKLSTSMEGLKNSFESVETGIQDIKSDDPAKPRFLFGEAIFEGLKSGDQITVYTLDGKAVSHTTANANGSATINISNLGKGIFILCTPSQSFKIKN